MEELARAPAWRQGGSQHLLETGSRGHRGPTVAPRGKPCLSLGALFLFLPLTVVELLVNTPVMLALGTPLGLDQETQPGERCELVLRLPSGPHNMRAWSRGGPRVPFLGLGGVLTEPSHRLSWGSPVTDGVTVKEATSPGTPPRIQQPPLPHPPDPPVVAQLCRREVVNPQHEGTNTRVL